MAGVFLTEVKTKLAPPPPVDKEVIENALAEEQKRRMDMKTLQFYPYPGFQVAATTPLPNKIDGAQIMAAVASSIPTDHHVRRRYFYSHDRTSRASRRAGGVNCNIPFTSTSWTTYSGGHFWTLNWVTSGSVRNKPQ
jgi:hypothetical protein